MDVRRDRTDLLEAVKRGLEDLYPDLEIVDEDLELEREGRRADLVGVDGEGRLALVFVGFTDGEEPLLELVDALSFAHKNHALLTGHFHGQNLHAERRPTAFFVARSTPPRLLARLESLATDRVRLLELRSLSSARGGDRVYLVPVYPASSRLAPLPKREVESFLRRLPPEQRARAHGLLKRIFRIDDHLEFESGPNSLVWSLEGRPLCAVGVSGRELVGSVPPDESGSPLREEPEVEEFLGRVLLRCVGLLSPEDPNGSKARPQPRPPFLPSPPRRRPEAGREAKAPPVPEPRPEPEARREAEAGRGSPAPWPPSSFSQDPPAVDPAARNPPAPAAPSDPSASPSSTGSTGSIGSPGSPGSTGSSGPSALAGSNGSAPARRVETAWEQGVETRSGHPPLPARLDVGMRLTSEELEAFRQWP